MARNFVIEADGYPDWASVILAIVLALKEIGGIGTNDKVKEQIIKNVGISDVAQSYLMPDGKKNKLDDALAWSRTYLKHSGTLENPKRGVWKLTEEGFKINDLDDAEYIFKKAKENIKIAKALKNKQKNQTQPTT